MSRLIKDSINSKNLGILRFFSREPIFNVGGCFVSVTFIRETTGTYKSEPVHSHAQKLREQAPENDYTNSRIVQVGKATEMGTG